MAKTSVAYGAGLTGDETRGSLYLHSKGSWKYNILSAYGSTDYKVLFENHKIGFYYTNQNSRIILNHGADGIYLTGSTISWHDSNNAYVAGLLSFAADGTTTAGKLNASSLTVADEYTIKSRSSVLNIQKKSVGENVYKATTMQINSGGVADGIEWSLGLVTQGGSTVNTVGSGVGIVMSGYGKGNAEHQVGRGAGIAAVVESTWYNKTGLAFYTNHDTSSGTVDNFTEKLRLTNVGNLIPKHSTTQTLGDSSNRWSTLYAKNVNVNGNVTLSSGTMSDLTNAGTLIEQGGMTLKSDSTFIKFRNTSHTGDYQSIIKQSSANLLSINDQVFAKYGGNVAIGTETISGIYKLWVEGRTYLNGELNAKTLNVISGANIAGETYIGDGDVLGGYDGTTQWSIGVLGNAAFKEAEIGGELKIYGADSQMYGHKIRLVSENGPTIQGFYDTLDRVVIVDAAVLQVKGTVVQSSDATLKDILSTEPRFGVKEIANAPLVYFNWLHRKDTKQHLGSIAQYWNVVTPECVRGNEGNMSMDYATLGLVSGIINARKIVDHEERIKALEEENERLREQIVELKKTA